MDYYNSYAQPTPVPSEEDPPYIPKHHHDDYDRYDYKRLSESSIHDTNVFGCTEWEDGFLGERPFFGVDTIFYNNGAVTSKLLDPIYDTEPPKNLQYRRPYYLAYTEWFTTLETAKYYCDLYNNSSNGDPHVYDKFKDEFEYWFYCVKTYIDDGSIVESKIVNKYQGILMPNNAIYIGYNYVELFEWFLSRKTAEKYISEVTVGLAEFGSAWDLRHKRKR